MPSGCASCTCPWCAFFLFFWRFLPPNHGHAVYSEVLVSICGTRSPSFLGEESGLFLYVERQVRFELVEHEGFEKGYRRARRCNPRIILYLFGNGSGPRLLRCHRRLALPPRHHFRIPSRESFLIFQSSFFGHTSRSYVTCLLPPHLSTAPRTGVAWDRADALTIEIANAAQQQRRQGVCGCQQGQLFLRRGFLVEQGRPGTAGNVHTTMRPNGSKNTESARCRGFRGETSPRPTCQGRKNKEKKGKY